MLSGTKPWPPLVHRLPTDVVQESLYRRSYVRTLIPSTINVLPMRALFLITWMHSRLKPLSVKLHASRLSRVNARGGAMLSLVVFSLILAGCDSAGASDGGENDQGLPPGTEFGAEVCELPENSIFSGGVPKDGIPALTNPTLVSADEISYLQPTDRIIGIFDGDQAIAIPHNILWWHEIMNYTSTTLPMAITYCPLTGSSIVFDRTAVGGAELGVSGLLYNNNLIMYDRNETEALWSQMLSGAGCDSEKGFSLSSVSHVEMTWAGWSMLYPDTRVISSSTGFSRNYTLYPYGNYEAVDNGSLLFDQGRLDDRRPPKERVLGIPGTQSSAALTFPFGMLNDIGSRAVVSATWSGEDLIVMWDESKQAAAAFRPHTTDFENVEMVVEGDLFVDTLSGSVFDVTGRATEGTLAGNRLEPVDEAYVAFWFSWPAFHRDTQIFNVEM